MMIIKGEYKSLKLYDTNAEINATTLQPFRKVLISLVNYCLLEIISQIAQLLFCFSNREIKIQ